MREINKSNLEAYSLISVEELQSIAKIGGLDNGCDINLIKSHILRATSILEVGAGYGRALKHIIDIGYKGKLTAIEYNPNFCEELYKKFSDRVEILNANLLDIDFIEKFDCILWLWSGISDFSKTEQNLALHKLFDLLHLNGILIFDIIPPKVIPLNVEKISDQEFNMQINGKILASYCPTFDEINNYATQLNVQKRHNIEYITDIGRKRIMHIFNRSKE